MAYNNKHTKQQILPVSMGKLPPQAIEAEEAVLGALLTDKRALDQIADILKADMFYKSIHTTIFNTITALYSASQPTDIITVMQTLRKDGKLEEIGGAYYLTQLSDRVVSSHNIEAHAYYIVEKYIQREMIRTSTEAIERCYAGDEDVFDTISRTDLQRDEMLNRVTVRKTIDNATLFTQAISELEISGHQDGITGIPSGFEQIDRITGGWQKTDLIILAARPSMGKSSLCLQIGLNAAYRFNKPGSIFSLEMSNTQLMNKQLAIECNIPLYRFRKKMLDQSDWSIINHMKYTITKAPIHWDDTPSLSITELRAKARRLKAQYDIQWIIIDYLQLMTTGDKNKHGNREQEISFISRSLKSLAKELEIPIIALSQLSRALESRPGNNKRPMLSDLRESGAIEQDADMVLFLYRPEYYNITEYEDGTSTSNMAELIIAKHRNGELDDILLTFNKDTTSFTSYIQENAIGSNEEDYFTDANNPFINMPRNMGYND